MNVSGDSRQRGMPSATNNAVLCSSEPLLPPPLPVATPPKGFVVAATPAYTLEIHDSPLSSLTKKEEEEEKEERLGASFSSFKVNWPTFFQGIRMKDRKGNRGEERRGEEIRKIRISTDGWKIGMLARWNSAGHRFHCYRVHNSTTPLLAVQISTRPRIFSLSLSRCIARVIIPLHRVLP